MSDRSTAWYADPENRKRRKARMRAYGSALVALSQRFPEEKRLEYQAGKRAGLGSSAAQRRASARLREAHRKEFQRIFEEKLSESTASVAPE